MTRDLEKFAFENNCSKWREIWLLARRVELMAKTFAQKDLACLRSSQKFHLEPRYLLFIHR